MALRRQFSKPVRLRYGTCSSPDQRAEIHWQPGRDPGGFIITILIGIAGAYLARFIGSSLFQWYQDGTAPGWIASILGAMLLLWIYRMFQKRAG